MVSEEEEEKEKPIRCGMVLERREGERSKRKLKLHRCRRNYHALFGFHWCSFFLFLFRLIALTDLSRFASICAHFFTLFGSFSGPPSVYSRTRTHQQQQEQQQR